MSTLNYNKLNAHRREIRLLSLKPGAWNEGIECMLSTVSLDDRPVYEALSYVWGSLSAMTSITIDGVVTSTTINAASALRRLRKIDTARVIWIDALCINQSDVSERSSQVSIMGDIYKQTVEVQIWLGESEGLSPEPYLESECSLVKRDKDLPLFQKFLESKGPLIKPAPLSFANMLVPRQSVLGALEILKLFAADKHFYEMPFFRVTPMSTIDIDFGDIWYASLRSLSEILNRPWWKRIWIVQEAVLPVKATINIGIYHIDLSVFLIASQNFQKHAGTCCKTCMDVCLGRSDIPNHLATTVHELHGIKTRHHNNSLNSHAMFFYSRNRNATDPRDYVYALLELLGESFRLNIVPDYSLSVAQVYSSAAQILIRRHSSLFSLYSAVRDENQNPYQLPSWVPDWSLNQQWRFNPYSFHASNDAPHDVSNDNGMVLSVNIVEFDNISNVKEGFDNTYGLITNYIVTKVQEWYSLTQFTKPLKEDAFLRAVFQDLIVTGGRNKRMGQDDLNSIKRWWDLLVNHPTNVAARPSLSWPPPDESLLHVHTTFASRTEGTKFFATKRGLLGNGPRSLRLGDKICIAKGSRVPLIFRLLDGSAGMASRLSIDQLSDCYSFVGPCYVHEIMDGEAIESNVDWKVAYLY
jgi:hypothetical protein